MLSECASASDTVTRPRYSRSALCGARGAVPRCDRLILPHRGTADKSPLHGRCEYRQRLYGRSGRAAGIGRVALNATALLLPDAPRHGKNVPRPGVKQNQRRLRLPALPGRKMRRVPVVGIHQCLQFLVHRRIYRQTAGIEQCGSLRGRIAQPLLQVAYNIRRHRISKPAGHAGLVRVRSFPGIKPDAAGDRLHPLCLGDIPLPAHLGQDQLPAGAVFVRMRQRVIAGRVLRNGGKGSAFRQRQLRHRFGEAAVGGGTDSETAATQIDDIQVCLQNLGLIGGLLQRQRAEYLGEFPIQRVLVPPCQVLDELLCHGGAAEGAPPSAQIVHPRMAQPQEIHAVVVKKAFVLNGQERVDQLFRKVAVRDVQATPGGADVPVSGGMPFAARGGAVFRIVGIQHGRFADAAQIGNNRRGFLRRAGVPLQPHGSGNRDACRREQAKRQKNAQKPNQTMHDDNSPPNPGCPVLRRAIRRRTDIVAGGAYNYTHGGHDK